ncbi:MAG TPA: TolC family protein [Phycisphaerae bacterium]|nr:TolC family protein [Phycisphaerae bacterium]
MAHTTTIFRVLGVTILLAVAGPARLIAQQSPPDENAPVNVQSQGQVQFEDVPLVAQPTPAQPVGDFGAGQLIDPERLRWHVPDPAHTWQEAQRLAAEATRTADRDYYNSLVTRIDLISHRPKIVLTLQETLHRAMVNNLSVRVAGYNPAIETTRVIEAEAAFDATLFYNLTKNKQNVPVASQLIGSNTDSLRMDGGITKRLATGMQATASLNLSRQNTDNQFQSLNPAYNSQFIVELRQPFLRGFGIDYNRSLIRVARLDQHVSDHAFRRQVIQTLRDVERAYWDLVIARRDIVIAARLLSDFEQIYNYLWQRRDFDAYKIQLADTKARLEKTKATFIQVTANVRNAEDRLINLMNDPAIDLADDIEIIPTDFPSQTPVVLDRLSEIQAALDHRPELHEAQLTVKKARIGVGRAGNEALPRLDVTFQYAVDGLGTNAHNAFSEVTKNDFHEYFVGVELEWPIGNRARRAAAQRARLQHGQAIANLERTFEDILFDVNLRVREVGTSYDQILPNFESVEANEDQHEALVARAESKNFLQLNQELNTLQALANARRELLRSLAEYTMAIVELERAKGTLPEYNNIIISNDID